MATVRFVFVAAKPFEAEHPLGSGTYVRYEPGDVVPAEEWGMAAGHMTTGGTIMRYAVNEYEPGDEPPAGSVAAPSSTEVPDFPGSDAATQPVRVGDAGPGGFGNASTPGGAPDEGEPADGDAEDGAEDDTDAETSGFPRHLGSGLYELSNGKQVRGKRKAEAAEEALA